MSTKYTKQQIIFSLNSIANLPSGKHGTVAELEAGAKVDIQNILADSAVMALIGEWDLVWGPVVYQAPRSTVADNAMYVAQSVTDPSEFVVAISGTNPISAYGWIVEDLMIVPPVAWPYGNEPSSTSGEITHGTFVGLQVLLNTLQDNANTLFKYLESQVAASQTPLSITVTGHSLGGALSPVTALALLDSQGVASSEPNGWDPSSESQISVVPTAGPTPGNETWRNYYDSRLGASTDRLWNAIDMVPHAWQISMLNDIPTLYVPDIPESSLVEALIKIAVANSTIAGTISGSSLQQICPSTAGLPGVVDITKVITVRDLIAILETMVANKIIDMIGKQLKLSDFVISLLKLIVDEYIKHLNRQGLTDKVTLSILKDFESANTSTLKSENSDLEDQFMDFLNFLVQAGYQHTTAYSELLGTTAYSALVNKITANP